MRKLSGNKNDKSPSARPGLLKFGMGFFAGRPPNTSNSQYSLFACQVQPTPLCSARYAVSSWGRITPAYQKVIAVALSVPILNHAATNAGSQIHGLCGIRIVKEEVLDTPQAPGWFSLTMTVRTAVLSILSCLVCRAPHWQCAIADAWQRRKRAGFAHEKSYPQVIHRLRYG